MSKPVIVWTRPGCVQCNWVIRLLEERGVEYETHDLTAPQNEDQLEHFRANGFLSAPITEFGGDLVAGFNPAAIKDIAAAWKEQ